ncbi:MAG: flagellar biosynthesis anti-sigma factor FlgM [Firmicutes bacterium]|nr:flagellar biosynthesis anti-sigma factor FlgM [Bacillota bacterium]
MIISNKGVQRIARIYQEQKQVSQLRKQAKSAAPSDEVELSTEGKEMQALLRKLKDAPEVRPAAEKIKRALESDTYEVSAKQIALGILKSRERGW